jgi:hypothetical protein
MLLTESFKNAHRRNIADVERPDVIIHREPDAPVDVFLQNLFGNAG